MVLPSPILQVPEQQITRIAHPYLNSEKLTAAARSTTDSNFLEADITDTIRHGYVVLCHHHFTRLVTKKLTAQVLDI